MKNAQRLILASSSPYRQTLLKKICPEFESIAPNIDETPRAGETAPQLAARLALEKAQSVASTHRHTLIIGSDQVALHPDGVAGKPGNRETAVRQLKQTSGCAISLHTGLVLLNAATGRFQQDVIEYKVHLRHLSDELIQAYLDLDQPYDCTGSLKIEGAGIRLIERLEGDDPNALIGLPLIRLTEMLEAEGYRFLPF